MISTESREQDGICFVALIGEAGVAEAQTLSVCTMRLAAARPPRLVFDLSRLSFISSLAMGELVGLATALRQYGCRLALAGATVLVRGALQRVRLDETFEFFDTADAARAAFSQ